MTWVKLDDRFCDHPKIAGLSDRAFRAQVAALCYSAGVLSDGRIPQAVGVRIAGRATRELEAKGVWQRIGQEGWQLHDFLDYQPSREKVLARRAADSVRKTTGHAGASGSRKKPGSGKDSKRPDPTSTPKTLKASADFAAAFDRLWTANPKKKAKGAAETAFRAALRIASADEIIAGMERYRDDPSREAKFTMNPATWLRGKCWEDEPETARPPTPDPQIHVAPEVNEPEAGWGDAVAAIRPDFKKAAADG